MSRSSSSSGRSALRHGAIGAASIASALAVHAATYRWWRPWCIGWGATKDEVAAGLPGDDPLATPDVVTTRAVTIAAPPGDIWPWLVQMGPERGGAYTYDWIENLFGLGMHSANTIVPEYQHLEVGDAQHLGEHGPVLRVASFESERSLVLRSDDGNWIWSFSLVPSNSGTRLISRNRITTPGASKLTRAMTIYGMEPGSLIMERKMLLGIRQRVERGVADARRPGEDAEETTPEAVRSVSV